MIRELLIRQARKMGKRDGRTFKLNWRYPFIQKRVPIPLTEQVEVSASEECIAGRAKTILSDLVMEFSKKDIHLNYDYREAWSKFNSARHLAEKEIAEANIAIQDCNTQVNILEIDGFISGDRHISSKIYFQLM